jgi:hypothetical protein
MSRTSRIEYTLCFKAGAVVLKPSVMKINQTLLGCFLLLAPFLAFSQVATTDSLAKAHAADSLTKLHQKDSLAKHDSTLVAKKDSVPVVKNCYTEWTDAFRTRGAKAVPDGMQQVVIALKGDDGSHCYMGQVEVVGGKIKPPLYFQKQNGEYHLVSLVGKKIEPAFEGTMSADELYAIKDGMSIVFRTTDKEYGRIFFYKFVNTSSQGNKTANSPSDLIKE